MLLLQDKMSPLYDYRDVNFIHEVNVYVRRRRQDHDPETIQFTTLYLKKKNAPGPDNICNRALLHLPTTVAITNILNSVTRLRHFP